MPNQKTGGNHLNATIYKDNKGSGMSSLGVTGSNNKRKTNSMNK
jgi:hypothetical protein